MAKASNLASEGLTPLAAAARSSSRTAAHALPVRDPANRSAAAHARTARTSASTYPFSGELGPQSPNWGNGTPLIPSGPPVHATCDRTPRHNRAKREGDHRQVLASRANGWHAKEEPEPGRHQRCDGQRQAWLTSERGQRGAKSAAGGGQQCRGVAADREKGRVAKVEHAGETHHDIQPHRQRDEQQRGCRI